MQRHAVRFTIPFCELRPFLCRRDLEQAAERDIDHIHVALEIKRNAFDETIHWRTAHAIDRGPLRSDTLAPELVGHFSVDFGPDELGARIEIQSRLRLAAFRSTGVAAGQAAQRKSGDRAECAAEQTSSE